MQKTKSLCIGILTMSLAIMSGPSVQAGFEIADVTDAPQNGFEGFTRVYLDYGDHRITAEEWENFQPPSGYLKNTPRNGQFNDENTFSSPGMPAPEVEIEDIGGYTWKYIAQIQSAMWPYDSTSFPETLNAYHAAWKTTTPPAGTIKFSSNEKNQEMIFWAREGNVPTGALIERYYITDTWGNKYIMGASGSATPEEVSASFDASVLPDGWTKSSGYLDETLSLFPAYGADDQAHYNLFRENSDNTFFQFEWGLEGHSIAEQITDMPIWGGATDDTIFGRVGDDNIIHGADGSDFIIVMGENDHIYGDAGVDTIRLSGNFSDYTILSYTNGGKELTIFGFGYEKFLYDTEFLEFDDMTFATSIIPEPSAALLLAGAAVVFWRIFGRRLRSREIA